jgi:hypothetical protein
MIETCLNNIAWLIIHYFSIFGCLSSDIRLFVNTMQTNGNPTAFSPDYTN